MTTDAHLATLALQRGTSSTRRTRTSPAFRACAGSTPAIPRRIDGVRGPVHTVSDRQPLTTQTSTPSALQPTLEAPQDSLPAVSIDELPDRLKEAVARPGWTSLMPVQSQAIPYLLAGRDLVIQARTGAARRPRSCCRCWSARLDGGQDAGARAGADPRARPAGAARRRDAVVRQRLPDGRRLRRRRLRPQIDALRRVRIWWSPRRAAPSTICCAGRSNLGALSMLVFDEADRDALDGVLSRHEAGADVPAQSAGPHDHVLGDVSGLGHADRARIHRRAGVPDPQPRPRPRHRHGAHHLHRAADGEGPRAGADHRGREPVVGVHLLQHEVERALRHGGAAALRLRTRTS